MKDPKKYIQHYLEHLVGPGRDDAFHSLIEADDIIVPFLIEAFQTEQNLAVRSELVEIIWQHRLPESTDFLADLLNDKNPEIWKNALDGLVAIGGQLAIDAILLAQRHSQNDQKRLEWFDDALEQIEQ